jgi:hypothetical protein
MICLDSLIPLRYPVDQKSAVRQEGNGVIS